MLQLRPIGSGQYHRIPTRCQEVEFPEIHLFAHDQIIRKPEPVVNQRADDIALRAIMKPLAVCLSKTALTFNVEMPFYCHTRGWRPIFHHDNKNMPRLEYLTDRYNQAIQDGLFLYPETSHILIIDSYYLKFASQVKELLQSYQNIGIDTSLILGASIWYWDRSHIRPCIRYYDTASAIEMRGRKWYKPQNLPNGLMRVSGVGACWILPRKTWEESDGFVITDEDPVAGSSRSLTDNARLRVLLNCSVRLWRNHSDNPDIPDYAPSKRIRVSLGEIRRKIWT